MGKNEDMAISLMGSRLVEVCDLLFDKMKDTNKDKSTIEFEFRDVIFQISCKKKVI